MKYTELDAQDALRRGMQLPYAMLRFESRVTLGLTPQQIDEGTLLEARFFSEAEEIRLFQRDGVMQAVCLQQARDDCTLCETYELENKQFGAAITVTRLLEADEDGQMYVAATRLSGWKGAETHG